MNEAITQELPSFLGPGMVLFFLILGLWSAVWKAIALWKAARAGSKPWYVVLFIINTAGILEIIYIFAIARKKSSTPLAPTKAPSPQQSPKA